MNTLRMTWDELEKNLYVLYNCISCVGELPWYNWEYRNVKFVTMLGVGFGSNELGETLINVHAEILLLCCLIMYDK